MERKLKLHILLADDDIDDCDLFKEALDELAIATSFTLVHNGMQLLNYLTSEAKNYPDILFLDLNMPRKSGLECIKEIKSSIKISSIPIVIYSTSYNTHVVDQLYNLGANYYIQKPSSYTYLKKVINEAIQLISKDSTIQNTRANFVIKP